MAAGDGQRHPRKHGPPTALLHFNPSKAVVTVTGSEAQDEGMQGVKMTELKG